ncbi:uncharacterized protein LTR77_003294 [Saxophila tyrrhenica]|uniref:Cytochrome c oxidase assembly protein COX20, mitochondrial n=1 Tax=Saxophila tyrrhenica TaxID=1690608 RepID=A0AAV9PHL2_9PEZI|nr:hypothetical protein LTR77_003294 [Saxophila tyrrhenica]
MADDTRQSPKTATTDDGVPITKEGLTAHPENKPFAGQQWQDPSKDINPPQGANLLSGGTQNTAGGKAPEVSIGNAFQNGITFSDFAELPKRPCVRDAGMTGLGSGFALGGLRFMFRAGVFSACNWAVFGTCFGSGIMYQYCLYKRQAERDGMIRAVEIMNKNQLEKQAREQAKERQKEERRKLKDQELEAHYAKLRDEEARNRPWWKALCDTWTAMFDYNRGEGRKQ